jgi:hypothetical protein
LIMNLNATWKDIFKVKTTCIEIVSIFI